VKRFRRSAPETPEVISSMLAIVHEPNHYETCCMVANILGAVWGFRGAPRVERASHAVYVTSLAAMAEGWARLRTPAASEKDVRRPHD
jgi:hypothetical protein